MIRVMGFICFVLFFWQLTFVPESNAAIRQKMSRAMSSDNFVKRTTPEEDAAMEAAAAQGNIKAKKADKPKTKEEIELEQLYNECERDNANFNRSCAAKLFRKLCGNLVFTEEGMPPKVSVVKGSVIELQLENEPRSFWKILNSRKDVLQKQAVTREDGKLIVKYKACGKGETKLSLYNMTKNNDDYTVTKVKFFRVYVD